MLNNKLKNFHLSFFNYSFKMPDYCIGLDIGTSSAKAGVLNLSTYSLNSIAYKSYSSGCLQDTGEIFDSVLFVLKETLSSIKNKKNIKAIGLSGQMHGTVLYDSKKNIISPVINWQDGRCNIALNKYKGRTTIDIINDILVPGSSPDGFKDLGIDRISSGFFAATLFHIKEIDKSFFSTVKHAVLPVDFIRGKLLGKLDCATDQTNAFSTGLFNTRYNKWHRKYIEKLGLPFNIFPTVHYTSDISGYIGDDVKRELRLDKDIPVIYGGGDNQLSILGSGLFYPGGPALVNIGTASQVSRIISAYKKLEGIDTRSFFNGMYALVGASLAGGTSYSWLRDRLSAKMHNIDFYKMDRLAEKVEPLSGGLKFCTGPSREKPFQKKGFYGNIKKAGSAGHAARAVMEGVVFELYDFYKRFGQDTNNFLIGSGNGLTRSSVWPQITADIFGKDLKIIDTESAVFGAALIAACGINYVKDLKAVFSKIKYITVKPNRFNKEIYQKSI